VSLIGCQRNDFEDYIQSIKKTREIEKGQQSMDMKMNMDFDTEGLSSEEIKDINYFKSFESQLNLIYDNEADKTIARNYYNFGGIGFDTTFYDDGEKRFIRMPIIGKYLVLSEEFTDNYSKDVDGKNEYISKKTIEDIRNKWLTTIKSDDVFVSKDSFMTTPNGEVKVRKYTVNLTGEQFKNLLSESTDILLKDELLKETIEEYINKGRKKHKISDVSKLLNDFKEGLKKSKIDNLSYVAYIDIDGYIVKEEIKFDLKFIGSDFYNINGFKYGLEINRWDIESEQKFEFPEFTKENTLDPEEIEQGIPFMFENIFDKNE
jgi:hypothetical protein